MLCSPFKAWMCLLCPSRQSLVGTVESLLGKSDRGIPAARAMLIDEAVLFPRVSVVQGARLKRGDRFSCYFVNTQYIVLVLVLPLLEIWQFAHNNATNS
jgi:hypothetical protein